MASVTKLTGVVLCDTLVNYLVSMSRTVEEAMNRALDALVNVGSSRTADLTGEVFLLEPRINEMEIVIDEHAIRLLRRSSFNDDEMRLIVAALKITNDLERIGDLAVNLAECVISFAGDAQNGGYRGTGAHGFGRAHDGRQESGGADS
jgi:phosphate uptake regulator